MSCNPPFSLIKYEPPLQVSDKKGQKSTQIESQKPPESPRKSKTESAAVSREILNAIVVPRLWKEENGTWKQNPSMQTPTRVDVVKLQESLDAHLKNHQARCSGICSIREKIYVQVFDELIRQTTLTCPERGLMLLRVRDEIKMSIAVYQTLHNTSMNFGINKTVTAEKGIPELERKVATLQNEKEELEIKILEIKNKISIIEKDCERKRERKNLQHKNVIAFLKNQIHHLEAYNRQNAESN